MSTVEARAKSKTHRKRPRPDFEQIALVLQGGGALGAYQAGVYEALAEADLHPDWVAGISIGAINTAIIVGNPPESRADKLREFWEGATSPIWQGIEATCGRFFATGDALRSTMNQLSAGFAIASGASGFSPPPRAPPWRARAAPPKPTSYYTPPPFPKPLGGWAFFNRII